jgi:hypothetical protein
MIVPKFSLFIQIFQRSIQGFNAVPTKKYEKEGGEVGEGMVGWSEGGMEGEKRMEEGIDGGMGKMPGGAIGRVGRGIERRATDALLVPKFELHNSYIINIPVTRFHHVQNTGTIIKLLNQLTSCLGNSSVT